MLEKIKKKKKKPNRGKPRLCCRDGCQFLNAVWPTHNRGRSDGRQISQVIVGRLCFAQASNVDYEASRRRFRANAAQRRQIWRTGDRCMLKPKPLGSG